MAVLPAALSGVGNLAGDQHRDHDLADGVVAGQQARIRIAVPMAGEEHDALQQEARSHRWIAGWPEVAAARTALQVAGEAGEERAARTREPDREELGELDGRALDRRDRPARADHQLPELAEDAVQLVAGIAHPAARERGVQTLEPEAGFDPLAQPLLELARLRVRERKPG